jgi:hypothetical protein
MITRRGSHIAGGKVSGSHTTVIDAVRKVVVEAQKDVHVTKIVLGVITPRLPVGKHTVKFLPIQGGFKVVVRGTNSKQELYIYTRNYTESERIINALFES